jgi:hypothetical protein
MAGKNTAAFGIYRDEASVKNAVETLQRHGFRSTAEWASKAKDVLESTGADAVSTQ